VYASVQDMRDEGVTEAQASDARLAALLVEASETIDHIAGWGFEPREWTLRLDGTGRPSLEPPVAPIALTELWIGSTELRPEEYRVIGAPVVPGFVAPRLELLRGSFPRGQGNVLAVGTWGYTEPDATPFGRTPWAIRRACMLLVMRLLPNVGDQDALQETRDRLRVIEMRTRDQAVRFGTDTVSRVQQHSAGDPDVDAILIRYRRPIQLGAV
jgi:hypothetical protein